MTPPLYELINMRPVREVAKTNKNHVKVDSFGLPLEIKISEGHHSDIIYAQDLITTSCDYLLADRGYDSDQLCSFLISKKIIPVIPGRKNRRSPISYDKYIYKERNNVERFFNKLKANRRISSRFDKTALMFRGALIFSSILLWLKF